MESIVYEDSPLANYLREDADADASEPDWAPVTTLSERALSTSSNPSPPPSPTPFAPTGRPLIKARFRNNTHKQTPTLSHIPKPQQPQSLRSISRNFSQAVVGAAANIDGADDAKFLEKFRYIIVASQLLSGHAIPGQSSALPSSPTGNIFHDGDSPYSTQGMVASVAGALLLALVLSWVLDGGPFLLNRKRLVILLILIPACVLLGQVMMRRQWLQYRRQQSLSEVSVLVHHSQEFDGASTAALALIQEVELVSRGYRLSSPLPPISRLEDRAQSRKCVRLRKALNASFGEVLDEYIQITTVVKGFSEQTNLEKYLDIYEISDFDISDANRGFDDDEFGEPESLRALKIIASRFHTVRKVFLCALLALDASAEEQDLLRWTTAVEALRILNAATSSAHAKLRNILIEEERFPSPTAQRTPLTPGRERWRSQLHKLNGLGTGIRGLQAKLQLLRDESNRALDDSSDISELGPHLMLQYESIGTDLKDLMNVWEEGKAALALGIDRNEKRLSTMSTLVSPTTSLSGLTTVGEEGNAAAALKALNGETLEADIEPEPEMFEAVAQPARQRSTLTRDERIIKMKEEREQKAQARQQMDATRGMLRELETVINLRPPRNRTSAPVPGRVVSM